MHQGLAVYGNKGSTDQHAYIQQLRDGIDNFFVTFVEVLGDEAGSGVGETLEVAPGLGAGDYLEGFFLGTRRALAARERDSIIITLRRLDARSLGMLIALFERAVGLYAAMIGVNAYHQPGVEAGKKAAGEAVELLSRLIEAMRKRPEALTAEGWADAIGGMDDVETVFKLLERLAANPERGVAREAGRSAFETTYGIK